MDWLKTSTAVVVWNDSKTYLIGVDHKFYNDIVNEVERGADWDRVMILIDPEVMELEDDDELDS
jgi:hypothetical protein